MPKIMKQVRPRLFMFNHATDKATKTFGRQKSTQNNIF